MNIKSLFIAIVLSSAPCIGADAILDFTNGVNTIPVVTPTVNGARITFNSTATGTNSGDVTTAQLNAVSLALSNLSYAIGANGTNFTLSVGLANTNFTKTMQSGSIELSNALASIIVTNGTLLSASNALFNLIGAAGISAETATNISVAAAASRVATANGIATNLSLYSGGTPFSGGSIVTVDKLTPGQVTYTPLGVAGKALFSDGTAAVWSNLPPAIGVTNFNGITVTNTGSFGAIEITSTNAGYLALKSGTGSTNITLDGASGTVTATAFSPSASTFSAAPVDLSKQVTTLAASADIALTHSTNRTAGVAQYSDLFIYSGATNRVLTLNSSWNLWGCTTTNTLRSNAWAVVHLLCLSGTSETNVHVSIDQQ